MSSILTVYGTLRFPPAALERWRRLPLHHDPPPDGDALFDQPCDEATVAAVLACDDIADPILQVIADDDELRVRAVLDGDTWAPWFGRLAALARAAARVGASGHIEAEDDGVYAGRLVVDRVGVRFEAGGRPRDRDAAAEVWARQDASPTRRASKKASKREAAIAAAAARPAPIGTKRDKPLLAKRQAGRPPEAARGARDRQAAAPRATLADRPKK